jgi:hypothetical protein
MTVAMMILMMATVTVSGEEASHGSLQRWGGREDQSFSMEKKTD